MFLFLAAAVSPLLSPSPSLNGTSLNSEIPQRNVPKCSLTNGPIRNRHHCVLGKRQWGPQGKLGNWGRTAPYFVHLSMLKWCWGRFWPLPIVHMSKSSRKAKMPFEWLHHFCLSPWVLFTSLEMQMEVKSETVWLRCKNEGGANA